MKFTFTEHILIGAIAGIAGYQVGQLRQMPKEAYLKDINNDGLKDILVKTNKQNYAFLQNPNGEFLKLEEKKANEIDSLYKKMEQLK